MTTYEKERYLISLYGYADYVTRITYWKLQYSYSHNEAVNKLYEYVDYLKSSSFIGWKSSMEV